ncbi:SAM-dependent methyltransferase [Salipaludibacillus keqinensis]|uniref:SAM-dependent methyltransferase n=1 Tax=Salipaludibacillus keqinensis TaxID=2045207 RepID=A0A323TG65_9BACI|nr:class I SAM-dependent methyltransferase [Salipaludibacillus keqinensis]PYZ93759.1 SAM-dependent methyltransferase [Salipaludibacillus keqinensis]
MEKNTNTEKVYLLLDEGSEILKNELDLPYLDALGEMGENFFQNRVVQEVSEDNKEKITSMIDKIPKEDIAPEEYRRAVQLAVLKGMKEATQPHHAMTPDAVSLFIGYIVNKLLSYDQSQQKPVLLDPAVGVGNLMTAVMNQMHSNAHFIGAEPDETLLKLAFVNANLQKHSVDLFHQDSVSTPTVTNVDLVVSDLPAGYYPNDEVVTNFDTRAEKGHSYVHHLLIEQSIKHVKPGGFVVFVVPNHLFQSDQSKQLHQFIKKEAVIYSFMQLPSSMFKNSQAAKSILVLRKRGEGIVEPKQALLAELPSFTKEAQLADMMQRISSWFDDLLKQEK